MREERILACKFHHDKQVCLMLSAIVSHNEVC